ncbi:MAG: BatD family protein, partial [Chloroflexota bacterium]
FSYFDPNSETYQTSTTQPIEINVAPDGSVTAPVGIDNDPIAGDPLGEIRPLKETLESNSLPLNLTKNFRFWLLWTVPLFLLIGQYGWHKRKENLMKNPEAKRNKKAAKKAYQALKAVDVHSPEYYNTVGRILLSYLSDKLNRSVAGLTQAELSGLLLSHGVSNEDVEQVRTCLTISEMGQYSPIEQGEMKDVHLETKALIAKLDKVL